MSNKLVSISTARISNFFIDVFIIIAVFAIRQWQAWASTFVTHKRAPPKESQEGKTTHKLYSNSLLYSTRTYLASCLLPLLVIPSSSFTCALILYSLHRTPRASKLHPHAVGGGLSLHWSFRYPAACSTSSNSTLLSHKHRLEKREKAEEPNNLCRSLRLYHVRNSLCTAVNYIHPSIRGTKTRKQHLLMCRFPGRRRGTIEAALFGEHIFWAIGLLDPKSSKFSMLCFSIFRCILRKTRDFSSGNPFLSLENQIMGEV